MATYEENALITVKDAAGNKYLLYPITKLECIEGMPDLDAGANGQALAKVAGALAWKSFGAADVGADPAGAAAVVQSNLTTHAGDAVKHITAAERTTWNGKEAALSGAAAKATPVDADTLIITDSASSNATKRITWANAIAAIKSALNSVYAAVTHTHAPTDLTSAVPITKGGTGATTVAAARTALAALGVFGPTAITISATWSGTGPYTQNVTVSGVTAAMDWRLGLHLAKITDDAARKLQEKAFACITWCETYAGGITLTCRDKKPDVAISAVLAGEV